MLQAVRASSGTTIDIDVINRVLLQPHWHNEIDLTDF
jgi:MSHA biogenesis protein MshM